MPTVLVVDDSTTDRRVVSFLLKRGGDWTIENAILGKEALDKMAHAEFDLVLADLLMPGMNGLELVAAIRKAYCHVPVILMTSRGNEGIAVLALREGAVSYIPKRLLPRKLVETVGRVMTVSGCQRSHKPLWGEMTDFGCALVLPTDVTAIQSTVLYLQENLLLTRFCDRVECTQIGVALQEALLNALYHGNLQMGTCQGGENEEEYAAVSAQRCLESPYRDRHIYLNVTLTPAKASFAIRDEGGGFDTSHLPDPCDVSALEKASGRGLILMRSFMDEVFFGHDGREVTLIKSRKTKPKDLP